MENSDSLWRPLKKGIAVGRRRRRRRNIAVVPTQDGMRTHRLEDSDVYFDETAKPVHYSPDLLPHLRAHNLEDSDVYFDETAKSVYYFLDLLAHQNLFEPNTLCKIAKKELIHKLR